MGFGLAIDPLYISEMSPAAHRGQLVTWSEMAINVGIVLGFLTGLVFYNVGEGLQWRLMFGMGCILPIILIVMSQLFMAESPRWLVSKGRYEEAKAILQKIYPEGRYGLLWATDKRYFAFLPTFLSFDILLCTSFRF